MLWLGFSNSALMLCMSECGLVRLSWHTFGSPTPDPARAEFSQHVIVRMFESAASLSFVALFQDLTVADRRGASDIESVGLGGWGYRWSRSKPPSD